MKGEDGAKTHDEADGLPKSILKLRREELLEDNSSVPLYFNDLQEMARKQLPKGIFDNAAGGAGSEETVRANHSAFKRYRIVTRVLQDVSEHDMSIEMFGCDLAAPLFFAPIGSQQLYHKDGEVATGYTSSDLNIPMILSTRASESIESAAEAIGTAPRFFQLYWTKDWEVAENMVKRAEKADYDGIVLTVDAKMMAWKPRDLQNTSDIRHDVPKSVFESDPIVQEKAKREGRSIKSYVRKSSALNIDPSITWDDLDQLRKWTSLPIILKGILSVEDARRAKSWGAEGIIVSNHGGREIDGEVSSLTQLPKIAEVVNDHTEILLDSGVRTGADLFKALALGADAVLYGRPYIFGLAIAGQRGVRDTVLNCLAELESIMHLSGRPTIDDMDHDALIERP